VLIQRPRHFERESLRQFAQMRCFFLWQRAARIASDAYDRLTPAILSVRNGYCGDGEVHGEE
jgi:hypothetical protein